MRHQIVASLICLLLIGVFSTALQCSPDETEPVAKAELSRFSSYQELKDFVKTSTESYGAAKGSERTFSWDQGALLAPESAAGATGDDGSHDYSGTNIQVAGVDEADIVKTDGEFIYLVSGKRLIIAKAYPAEEAQILSDMELDQRPEGIFISGDKLAVLHGGWDVYVLGWEERGEPGGPEAMPTEEPVAQSSIIVYDVSDRGNPVLAREVSVDGQYSGSRMLGNYVYAVINETVYDHDDQISLPRIHLGTSTTEIPAQDIYYCDVPDYWYVFTTIVAVNIQDDEEEPTCETLLVGATSNIYVSLDNIYITSTKWGTGRDYSEKTAIHRIHIENGDIEYQASGEAPGRLLNQFSMDEYRGFFRVATTTSNMFGILEDATSGDISRNTSGNHVYILNMDLEIVGRLEDLAPGESIYSSRFMGDRCYLVTFKKIDPLFVLDLRNPYDPKVLGELKITGYSDYLHPYDEDHIIGIGKEAVAAEEFDGSWYQGVKISLFDVSDVSEPKEVAKYEIGDRGTDSPVLRDHKAFLFDKSRNLLVMPVLVAQIDESEYPYGVPPQAYGEYVWQGAYVFDISLDGGLQLKGRISHYDDDDLGQQDYYFATPQSIERSLYIDDVLYTISDMKIKMNHLENLDYINEVELP